MSDRKKALSIGTFVIGSFSILAAVLLFLRPSYGDGEKTLKVRLVDIEKINVGTRVTFAGKPIGQVISIQAIPNARTDQKSSQVYAYELLLKIDSKTIIYESDRIQSQTSGLMGEKTIAIIPQIAPEAGLVPVEKEATIYSNLAPSVEDTVQRAGRLIVKAEESLDLLYHILKKGTGQIDSSLNQIQHASAVLEKILNEAIEINLIGEMKETAHQTSLAMSKINRSLEPFTSEENIQKTNDIFTHLTSILKAVDDPTKIKDLLSQSQMAMAQFHQLGNKANEAWPKLNTAIEQLASTCDHVENIAAKGEHALDNVQKISEHVFKGNGSLGKLLMRDNLYLDINETVARANVLLSDINNYGLFFSSNLAWKNQRAYRMDRLSSLKDPQLFNRYWQEQIQSMQINMGQLQQMMTQAKKVDKETAIQKDPEFKKSLTHILQSLGDLQEQLSLLTDQWTQSSSTSQTQTNTPSHP